MFQLAASIAESVEGTMEKLRGAEGAAVITKTKNNKRIFSYNQFHAFKRTYTRKCFRIQGERAHSLLCFCIQIIRKENEKGEIEQQQTHQFTKGCNILHRLQVHHLTLTFIIHNNIYQNYIYIHAYIHTYIYNMICSNYNALELIYGISYCVQYMRERTRIHDYLFQLWVRMLLEHQVRIII